MSPTLCPAEVVRAHAAFVWRVLRYQGVPEAMLEDASQEVFLVIVRSLDKFEGRSALQTWVYGVCRNVALHVRRSQARRRELLTDELPEVGVAETQSHDLGRQRALKMLENALAKLPEPNRMVFVLFEIEQLPMADVARAVSCPESTAYARLYSARSQLRHMLTVMGHGEAYREIAEAL
jgi:RNA polymerase sigma-70 factor (ECF subfamily)